MTTRRPFSSVALAGFLAFLLLAGSARAAAIPVGATVTGFDGQFSFISTAQPNFEQELGTGQSGFYLSNGIVTSTTDPSAFVNQPINQFFVDVTPFTPTNSFGVVTNFESLLTSSDETLLRVGDLSGLHADFTMADTALINSSLFQGTATASITIPVTLRSSSVLGGNDLSAFNTGAGGVFSLEFDNVYISPIPLPDFGLEEDGAVYFPFNPNLPVTVRMQLRPGTPAVPEPASVVSLLTGAGLLALRMRRRRAV